MSQVQPSPNTLYRIQNVDWDHYLEIPNPTIYEKAAGRPRKDTLKQQWKFIPDPAGAKNTYKIVNANPATEDIDTVFALGLDPGNTAFAEDADSSTTVWRIAIASNREHCSFLTADPRLPSGAKLHLQMEDDKKVTALSDNFRDDQKWKIVAASPIVEPSSLPSGTYRIRNIDGTSALTVHTNSLTFDPQEIGPHQAWEVNSKGNGDYEIKKFGQNVYLAWEAGSGGSYKATVSAQSFIWTILKRGAFESGLRPKIPGQILALSGLGKTNLPLASPDDTARNQVWFVDPYQFDPTINPDAGAAERRTEIAAGNYIVQNNSNKTYAFVSPGYTELYPYPPSSGTPSSLMFQYENSTSPYFTIRSPDLKVYIVPSGTVVCTSRTIPALWYLVKDTNNSGYYICPKPTAGQTLAWSGDSKSNSYTLVTRQDGAPVQIWTLIPRP